VHLGLDSRQLCDGLARRFWLARLGHSAHEALQPQLLSLVDLLLPLLQRLRSQQQAHDTNLLAAAVVNDAQYNRPGSQTENTICIGAPKRHARTCSSDAYPADNQKKPAADGN
jgi:hypothetical protein